MSGESTARFHARRTLNESRTTRGRNRADRIVGFLFDRSQGAENMVSPIDVDHLSGDAAT